MGIGRARYKAENAGGGGNATYAQPARAGNNNKGEIKMKMLVWKDKKDGRVFVTFGDAEEQYEVAKGDNHPVIFYGDIHHVSGVPEVVAFALQCEYKLGVDLGRGY